MGYRDRAIVVHTDGGCHPNPGPGGWAAIIALPIDGPFIKLSGAEPSTTNNRMELTAAIRGLARVTELTKGAPAPVTVVTDSQYVKRGITDWIHGWRQRGWRDIKNRDLWEELDRLTRLHRVRFMWVRGHSGDPLNEECDGMATAARRRLP